MEDIRACYEIKSNKLCNNISVMQIDRSKEARHFDDCDTEDETAA
jgi:hypothetical protein